VGGSAPCCGERCELDLGRVPDDGDPARRHTRPKETVARLLDDNDDMVRKSRRDPFDEAGEQRISYHHVLKSEPVEPLHVPQHRGVVLGHVQEHRHPVPTAHRNGGQRQGKVTNDQRFDAACPHDLGDAPDPYRIEERGEGGERVELGPRKRAKPMDADAVQPFFLGAASQVTAHEVNFVTVIHEGRGELPHSHIPRIVAVEHHADLHACALSPLKISRM